MVNIGDCFSLPAYPGRVYEVKDEGPLKELDKYKAINATTLENEPCFYLECVAETSVYNYDGTKRLVYPGTLLRNIGKKV